MLQDIIAGSEVLGLLTAAAIFVVLLLVAGVVNIVFRLLLKHWDRRDPAGLRIRVIRVIKGPLALFIATAGLFMGLLTLTAITTSRFAFLDGLETGIGKAWLVAVIAQVTYLIYRLLDVLLNWYITRVASRTETKLDDRLIPPIRRILPLVIYSLGTLAVLTGLGVPISPKWAGLGISGIAAAGGPAHAGKLLRGHVRGHRGRAEHRRLHRAGGRSGGLSGRGGMAQHKDHEYLQQHGDHSQLQDGG